MTKKELKWQVDDQQDQINELWKRIAILEARPTWTWTYQPQPFLGSTHNLLGTNIQRRDDGYEMHNKACSYGLGYIGGEGCICNR